MCRVSHAIKPFMTNLATRCTTASQQGHGWRACFVYGWCPTQSFTYVQLHSNHLRSISTSQGLIQICSFQSRTWTNDLQKQFVHRLGQLAGKPKDSTLHIHPVLNGTSEFGATKDNEISTISSIARKELYKHDAQKQKGRRYDAALWHSDIQFEPVPADYTSLRLTKLPKTGGDTLWASGYELYDRFSPLYQKFFENLTATFVGDGFIKAAAANPEKVFIYEEPRGSPQNVGKTLSAVHPVVRTNPVTGWKSIYALGPFPKFINELTADESDELLAKFRQLILDQHDLTVRFKWRNENDIAIWDNRSAFHTATFDYDGLGDRIGNRAVGIGEAPYFDPNSKSRSEDLGL